MLAVFSLFMKEFHTHTQVTAISNGENDESGTAARWHEGCSEKRRETAKRDTRRQTPQGGRRLAHHTLLSLKCVFFLSFLEKSQCTRNLKLFFTLRGFPSKLKNQITRDDISTFFFRRSLLGASGPRVN